MTEGLRNDTSFNDLNNKWADRIIKALPPEKQGKFALALNHARGQGDQESQSSFLRRTLTESTVSMRLGLAEIGVRIGQRFSRAGEFLTDLPIKLQFADDIANAAHSDDQTKITQLSEEYGLTTKDLSTITHPDFRTRIVESLALNTIVYSLPRQVLGWGVFLGLLASPEFRDMVDQNVIATTLASGGLLLAGGAVRARIDYKVLQDQGMSPDVYETTLGLLSGSIDNNMELKANPKWGFFGVPFDIGVSSIVPPFAGAWFFNMPYSVPAYLGAMYVDQVIFAGTNIGWASVVKIKEALHKRSRDEK